MALVAAGKSNAPGDLFACYQRAHSGNPGSKVTPSHSTTTTTTLPPEDTTADNTKFEIIDLTEIEVLGASPNIYLTPAGAKYERQANTKGKYASRPLIIRRVYSLGDDKPKVRLEIQSQALRDFLGQLPNADATFPVHEFPMKVPEPYNGLFYFRVETKRAESDPKYSTIRTELCHLLKFQQNHMQTATREIESFINNGEITFDHLWALFKPGDLVALWRLDEAGKPNYFIAFVHQFNYGRDSDGTLWTIQVLSTAIREDRVGSELNIFRFPAFNGTRKITELEVFPLYCHPDVDKIRANVLKRANVYLDAVRPLMERTASGSG